MNGFEKFGRNTTLTLDTRPEFDPSVNDTDTTESKKCTNPVRRCLGKDPDNPGSFIFTCDDCPSECSEELK